MRGKTRIVVNFKKRGFFGIILIIFFFIRCDTEGHRGTSQSILSSKDRGVFVCSYMISASDEAINIKLKSAIKEVFVENSWFVGKNKVDNTSFNIVIITKQDHFFNDYKIGDFTYTYDKTLVLLVDQSVLKDTLSFTIKDLSTGRSVADAYLIKN